MFHFAASETLFSENAFAERSAAATCLRDLMKKAKRNLDSENYSKLIDEEIIPVLSKGLMSKNERIQGEFIQVLICAIDENGNLGSHTDIKFLQSEKNVEEEINFFDNMKHIQKHR